jgi:hypothetical protein
MLIAPQVGWIVTERSLINDSSGTTYVAHGAPMEYRYGNNLWRDYTYNNRLQPLGLFFLRLNGAAIF